MAEYGCCVQCGKAINPDLGYSSVKGMANQRTCIACQFPAVASEPARSKSRNFKISAAAVERIGISFVELARRSRVAKEAYTAGKPLPDPRQDS